MNKIKYLEFDKHGNLKVIAGICTAKDFKRLQVLKEAVLNRLQEA